MLQGRRKTLLDKCSTASPIRGTDKLHTLLPVRKSHLTSILQLQWDGTDRNHTSSFCEMDVSK